MHKGTLRANLKNIILGQRYTWSLFNFGKEMQLGGYDQRRIAAIIDFAKSCFSAYQDDTLDNAIAIYVDDIVDQKALTPTPEDYRAQIGCELVLREIMGDRYL